MRKTSLFLFIESEKKKTRVSIDETGAKIARPESRQVTGSLHIRMTRGMKSLRESSGARVSESSEPPSSRHVPNASRARRDAQSCTRTECNGRNVDIRV